jgi:hypothetical protein
MGAGRISKVAVAFTEPTVHMVSAINEGHNHDRDLMPRIVKYVSQATAAHGNNIEDVRDWYAKTYGELIKKNAPIKEAFKENASSRSKTYTPKDATRKIVPTHNLCVSH